MENQTVVQILEDNKILIEGKEATCLGATQIITGVVNPEKREILVNQETGLNYSREAVEAQEIYNLKKQKHRPWFFLDLRTGGKTGNTWYPGCEIHADTLTLPIEVKAEPFENSITLYTIDQPSTVVVLDIDVLDQEPFTPGWHKINFQEIGYIKVSEITNFRYSAPNFAE